MVTVEHHGPPKQLPLIVFKTCDDSGASLLGHDWLTALMLDGASVYGECECLDKVPELLGRYANIFEPWFGLIKCSLVKLVFKEGSKPVFCKARQVPFALRDCMVTTR